MTKQNSTIDSLQVMRAFAAIIVLAFHGTHIIHDRLKFVFWNNIFDAGYSGVDIFFVISGFIILHTSMDKDFHPFTFLKKRFFRIYPIYWLFCIALIGMYYVAPMGDQAYKKSIPVILGSLSLFPQKVYLIGVAWTLTFEVLFYLFFAAAYSISKKFLFITMSGWSVVILTLYFLNIKSPHIIIDTIINPIIIEFFLGCLLAYVYHKYKDFKQSHIILGIGIILFTVNWLIYCYVKNTDPTAFSTYISRVYLFGLPSAILIWGVIYYTDRISPFLVYIGNASYSIYLIHGTVISLLLKLLLVFKIDKYFANNTGSVIILCATILIGCLFYRFVEKPLTNLFKTKKKIEPVNLAPISYTAA